MTGREIILFILENHLEDVKVEGWLTPIEVAEKFGVGLATVKVWIKNDQIEHIRILEQVYISDNVHPKVQEKNHE